MTEKEYNECVNLYADNVYRFILKNLRHEEDAKDVVQASFEKMWLNRDKVQNEKSKSYLFTVAYHQMIDLIRKNKRIKLEDDFSELLLSSAPADLFIVDNINDFNWQPVLKGTFTKTDILNKDLKPCQ